MKLYTSAAVARRLDMTERNVRSLKNKGVISEERPGLFNLQTVTVQYINFLRQKNPGAEGNVDYNTERAMLVRAKRESQELDLRLRKNEVHTSEDIELIMTDMLMRFRTRLMAIPAKMSPVLAVKTDQAEVYEILKQGVEEALEELSDYQTAFGAEKENEQEHSQPVQ